MEKKRVITSYNKLNPDLKKLWLSMYPDGYDQDVVEINNPIKGKFKAIFLETSETIYLVKVNETLRRDYKEDIEEEDEEVGDDEDGFSSSEDFEENDEDFD